MATRYKEGDTVDTPEGAAVVAGVMTEDFESPDPSTDDDVIEVEASSDNPAYIVGLLEGGMAVFRASELDMISEDEWEDIGNGKTFDSPDEAADDAEDIEMAEVYDYADDCFDLEDIQDAKREVILKNQSKALLGVRNRCDKSLEELQNIVGVDDPHVGFDEWPNGWTRKSLLDFWTTVGGTWRSCVARMTPHFGPNMSKRFCAAAKTQFYGTERWRGRF